MKDIDELTGEQYENEYSVIFDGEYCFDETEDAEFYDDADEIEVIDDTAEQRDDVCEASDEEGEVIKISNPIDMYRFLDEYTHKLVESVDIFKDFLIKATLLDRYYTAYDICDSILIYSQSRESRYVYDEQTLKALGIGLKEDASPIYLLDGIREAEELMEERNKPKPGRKGTKKTKKDTSNDKETVQADTGDAELSELLRVRRFYDISETESSIEIEKRMIFPDTGAAAEGIVMVRPCEIQFSKVALSRKYAFYDFDKNQISVTNGCKTYDCLFTDLVSEYAHYEFASMLMEEFYADRNRGNAEFIYNRKALIFHAECVAYILAILYGIDPGVYDITQLHQSWIEMSPINLRHNLLRILMAALVIDSRLQNLLYGYSQQYYEDYDTSQPEGGGDTYE